MFPSILGRWQWDDPKIGGGRVFDVLRKGTTTQIYGYRKASEVRTTSGQWSTCCCVSALVICHVFFQKQKRTSDHAGVGVKIVMNQIEGSFGGL